MKKQIAMISSAVLLATSTAVIAACGETPDEKRVMNISCNPSVEFILNDKNVVISANALNEEGNLILSTEAFVGKDAKAAANLFVEVSKETGFIVSGNASVGENEISISLSGNAEAATKLYNDVKTSVQSYLSSENITATLQQAQAISEEKLEALVAECAPYIEQAELQAMEYSQLLETLYSSRKETAEYYSQELKNAYYAAKEFAMEQAKLETLKSKVNGVASIAIETAYIFYTGLVEQIETVRMNTLVAPNSTYQTALATFREKKIEFLKYRDEVAAMEATEITAAVTQQLNTLEGYVNQAETALVNAGVTANDAIDTAKAQLKTAYNAVVEQIEQASVVIGNYVSEISTKQQAALTQLSTDFETTYATVITSVKNEWSAMKNQLTTPAD